MGTLGVPTSQACSEHPRAWDVSSAQSCMAAYLCPGAGPGHTSLPLDTENSQARDSTPVPKNVTFSGALGPLPGFPSPWVPSEQLMENEVALPSMGFSLGWWTGGLQRQETQSPSCSSHTGTFWCVIWGFGFMTQISGAPSGLDLKEINTYRVLTVPSSHDRARDHLQASPCIQDPDTLQHLQVNPE